LSSFSIKLLAMAAMLLDHTGLAFRPLLQDWAYYALRGVGRLAMPLFCFLIAEGLYHTRDVKKYLARLAVFALVSELPYDWFVFGKVWDFSRQNVGVTLFLGLLGIFLFDLAAAKGAKGPALLSIVSVSCLAELLRADYGAFGVYFIFAFYYFRGRVRPLCGALAAGTLLYLWAAGKFSIFTLLQPLALLALIPIALYSGEKGQEPRGARWLLYAFYPLHLALLAPIARAISAGGG